jgi:LytS/YehU family sensor histidine kinase
LVYWVVLGMGAGLQSFLGLRNKERRAADLELRTERLRAELARAQIGTLRNQLNPHFLFNALHSVGGLVRAGEEGAALRTLAAIGELLRSTLEQGEVEEVPLADELQIAERFLQIESIRLGDRLTIALETDQDVLGARVPSLLLLPLVENAVRHGIAPRTEGGRVRLRARREGSSLILEVSDDGLGFPEEVLRSGGSKRENGRRSIGLDNTRERLMAFYGDDQSFELFNLEPCGALVRVRLPYHETARAAATQPPAREQDA